ncbi:PrsW family intramembrane metalloprotease [Candidatus Peregrinibacteria bacterium]|nr:PrsW family intramembrane metalloprotease [Candidatus Peregrinibacteria bacterium]
MGGSVDNSVLQTVLTLAQPFIEFIKYQLPKAGLYALIASPAIIVWLFLAFSKTEKSRKVLLLVFGLGCLTAPFLLYVQYLWDLFPQFNLSYFIESNITSPNKQFIAMFILFAAMEEIVKMYVIRKIDEKTLLIDTLGNAIRYSTASALGFSFVENVYYLYQFGPTASTGDLITMYFFRSIFTTCAHMIFSGIFGYHYGIGKFSIDITKQQTISGERSKISGIIGKIFNLPTSQAYQQKMILKGLFLAVSIHATYNYLLQFNLIIPVVIFVILGYLYLRYLLSRKA